MRGSTTDRLEQEYKNLTEKQKAIIDTYAENPELSNRERRQLASEKIDDDINESYCSQVVNRDYPEIAEWRRQVVQGDQPTHTISVDAHENGVLLDLDKEYVRQLVEAGDLPAELHEQVVEAVVARAFDD